MIFRRISFILLCVLVAGGSLAASENVAMKLDFSNAYVVPGGPRGFFLRNVLIEDIPSAVYIEEHVEGKFAVREVYSEHDYLLPADSVWDLAAVYREDESTIVIDGVLLDGRLLSASFTLQDEDSMILQGLFDSTRENISKGYRAEGLLLLLFEAEMTRHAQERAGLRNEIAIQQAELLRMQEQIQGSEFLEIQYLEEIEALVSRVTVLESENASLEEQISELEYRIGKDPGTAGGGSEPVLTGEIQQLRTEIAQLRTELREYRLDSGPDTMQKDLRAFENELLGKLSGQGLIAMIQHRFTEDLPVKEGRAVFGDWRWSDSILRQQDASSLFARYRLPAPQDARPALYRMKARSTGSDWVGYGIHLQAHSVRAAGYGHGESLLVWLTRDRRAYGDDRSYLQLYRSYDDVDMRLELHAAIESPIDDLLELTVMLEPLSGYITVSVEGQDILRYKLPFTVDSGSEIALRSLDTAEFHELEARTVPEDLLW